MTEQKGFHIDTKTPEIQNILMSGRIGIISARIAELLGVDPVQALEMFYESETCRQLHNPETGLYLFGDQYIADEFLLEIKQ